MLADCKGRALPDDRNRRNTLIRRVAERWHKYLFLLKKAIGGGEPVASGSPFENIFNVKKIVSFHAENADD